MVNILYIRTVHDPGYCFSNCMLFLLHRAYLLHIHVYIFRFLFESFVGYAFLFILFYFFIIICHVTLMRGRVMVPLDICITKSNIHMNAKQNKNGKRVQRKDMGSKSCSNIVFQAFSLNIWKWVERSLKINSTITSTHTHTRIYIVEIFLCNRLSMIEPNKKIAFSRLFQQSLTSQCNWKMVHCCCYCITMLRERMNATEK